MWNFDLPNPTITKNEIIMTTIWATVGIIVLIAPRNDHPKNDIFKFESSQDKMYQLPNPILAKIISHLTYKDYIHLWQVPTVPLRYQETFSTISNTRKIWVVSSLFRFDPPH